MASTTGHFEKLWFAAQSAFANANADNVFQSYVITSEAITVDDDGEVTNAVPTTSNQTGYLMNVSNKVRNTLPEGLKLVVERVFYVDGDAGIDVQSSSGMYHVTVGSSVFEVVGVQKYPDVNPVYSRLLLKSSNLKS